MSNQPVKHHFVPQFMLRYFADVGERLTVHRIVNDKSFRSKVRDVGHRNDGHTVYSFRTGEPDRQRLESSMGEIEGAAAEVIRRLAGGADLDDQARDVLSWFMSLQWTRNRFVLGQVLSRAAEGGEAEFSQQELQSGLLHAAFLSLFEAWPLRNDDSVRPKERWNHIVSMLWQFDWKLARYQPASLIIGDTTVCLSGVAPGHTPEYNEALARHGIGVGFETCARITMPLTPQLGLLLTRDGTPAHLTAEQFIQQS